MKGTPALDIIERERAIGDVYQSNREVVLSLFGKVSFGHGFRFEAEIQVPS